MKKNILLSVLIFFTIHSSLFTASAQTWQELMDSTNANIEKQNFPTALVFVKQALAQAEKEYGQLDTNYAFTLSIIGEIYKYSGNKDSSEFYFEKCIKKNKEIHKGDNNVVANSLNNLANLFFDQGRFQEAEPIYKEILEIAKRLYKDDHPDLATSIDNLALLYDAQSRYQEAEPLFKEVLEIRRRLFKDDHPDVATSINNLASVYKDLGKFHEVEPLYKEALEMRRKLFKGDNAETAQSISNLGTLYQDQGRLQEAEPLKKETLEMHRRLYKSDHPEIARSLNNLAILYKDQGKFQKAEPLFIEALEIRRRNFKGDNPEVAQGLNNLAYLYKEQGRFQETEPLMKEALEMRRRIFKGDNPGLASSLNNTGLLYKDLGRLTESEQLFKETIEMLRRLFRGDHPYIAMTLNNLSALYQEMGRLQESLKLCTESLEMKRRLFKGDHPDVAGSINNLAGLYRDLNKFHETEQLYIEALEMRRRLFTKDHPYVAQGLNNLALFYDSQGRLEKAEPLLKEALEMYRRIFKVDNPDLANTISNLASIYQAHGKFQEAEQLKKEALEMRRRLFSVDHPDIAGSLISLASLYKEQGKFKETEPVFLEAIGIYKNIFIKNSSNLSEKEKGLYWKTLAGKFEGFISFAIRRMKDNPQILGNLFDIQLFTKSILFNTANKIKKRILASNDSFLVTQYRELINKKELLYKLYSTPVAQVKKQGYNIDSIETIANELEKGISLKSEDYKQSYERKKISWRTIQSLLKPDEAAVEMIRFNYYDKRWTDTVYYAALIITDQTTEYPDIVIIENGKELEEKYYAQYRNFMKNQLPDDMSFKYFWQKIYDKIKDYKKIYFSPDGIYNKLNISTMLMPNGKYLLDEQLIHTLNSTQDILLGFYSKQEESNIYNSCELFGNPDFQLNPSKMKEIEQKYADHSTTLRVTGEMERSGDSTHSLSLQPLPGTEKEVNNISDFFKSRKWVVNMHTGDDAVKAAVKTVNNPRVLHIATHGLFLTDIKPDDKDILGMEGTRVIENPLLRSGLFFAGASNTIEQGFNPTGYDNGFLTAYEAQNMDLDRTELVVLSACETGLGEIRNGEGVFGLQRAFQQAGAKSVLMSLWKVNDEATQELMTIFYKEWVSGKTKRDAFNTAQKKIRDKYKHPYYWGAFVMVGE